MATTATSNTAIVAAQGALSADTRIRSPTANRWIEAKSRGAGVRLADPDLVARRTSTSGLASPHAEAVSCHPRATSSGKPGSMPVSSGHVKWPLTCIFVVLWQVRNVPESASQTENAANDGCEMNRAQRRSRSSPRHPYQPSGDTRPGQDRNRDPLRVTSSRAVTWAKNPAVMWLALRAVVVCGIGGSVQPQCGRSPETPQT
jgi:hypothetical protein